MDTVVLVAQIIIALGILNVWIIRFSSPSEWRGGTAKTMKEEFTVYGLPEWAMWTVGFIKVSLAMLLIAAIWLPDVRQPSALGIAALMLGAVALHVKVKDPAKKSLPAFTMLVLALGVAFL